MDATEERKEEQKKEEQEKPVFSGDGSNDQDNLLSAGDLDLWTDEYEKPDKDPLPIHHRAVDDWLVTIEKERLLVIRGVDTEVLHAVEHAIAAQFLERFKARGATCRSLRWRSSLVAVSPTKEGASAGRRPKEASRSDDELDAGADQVLTVDSFHKSMRAAGKGPMLFTAAAYSGRFAELLASLPVDESVLSRTRGRFKERDRYLVVLTTPSDLPLNRIEQRLLPSFKGEADFVLPRLTFLGLEGLDEVTFRQACMTRG